MSGKRKKINKSLDTTASVADLAQTTLVYWRQMHLTDDLITTDLINHLTSLLDLAADRDLRSLGSVTAESGSLLATLAGCQSINKFTSRDKREQIHIHRNLLASLTLTAALTTRTNPKAALAAIAAPASGGRSMRRCFREDEILVLRLAALYRALNGDYLPACQYVLTESGAYPSETTAVCPKDFNDNRDPVTFTVSGVTGLARARTLELPLWSRETVRVALDQHLSRYAAANETPFLYRGAAVPGDNDAGASATTTLKRFLLRVGFDLMISQPLGITMWRTEKTLSTRGLRSAVAVSGKRNGAQVYAFIRKTDDEIRGMDFPTTYIAA